MMIRKAQIAWKGGLKDGSGHLSTASGTVQSDYAFGTRFGDDAGTNPEELIAAAHGGCYAMALAAGLEEAGHPPNHITAAAQVFVDKTEGGFAIGKIELCAKAFVESLDDEEAFARIAEEAKRTCPVSKALQAVEIALQARLAESPRPAALEEGRCLDE